MCTTTDISDFDRFDLQEAITLLRVMENQGLPGDFYDDGVTLMKNKDSGMVFLTNSEFQVAMMNGNALEIWNTCLNCGNEGFEEDCSLIDDGCNECNPIDETETEDTEE